MNFPDLTELIDIADAKVSACINRPLTNVEKKILEQALDGKKLKDIQVRGYADGTVQRDFCPRLWHLLSEALGQRVHLRTIRLILEETLRDTTYSSQTQANPEAGRAVVAQPLSTHPSQQVLTDALNVSFIGREAAIADLNALVRRGVKVIVIQAVGGVGKTTLAMQYFKTQGFDRTLELWMAKETQNLTSVESVLEEWLQRYFQEDAGREFGVTLERLRQKLRDSTVCIGVLIDNLEPALDQAGKFVQAHRRYVELLRVLADPLVNSVTLITSRERLREVDIPLEHYLLKSLNLIAWQQFFANCQIQPDQVALEALHTIYNGNAKAMEILRSTIQTDFTGSLTAYWQTQQDELFIEQDLEDLVITQVNRLQQFHPDAYHLLCRLGCYRYQDIATVDLQGVLALLWDVPPVQQRRVVAALQDRSLIEREQQSFWLHPVIRAIAVDRLRASPEWETANRQAAAFWTNSVARIETVDDALRAFEAYHHYCQINDFESAAMVIQNKRNERLGKSLYQLGLFQQTITATALLLEKLSGYQLSALYNLLAIPYRIVGEIHRALDYHKKAEEIANQYLEFQALNGSDESLSLVSCVATALSNIGLCQIQLWELDAALKTFTDAEKIATDEWKPFIFTFLAFLNSCLDLKRATFWIRQFDEDKLSEFSLIYLGETYVNLGRMQKAFKIYQTAEAIAEKLHHAQTLGRVKSNLAVIYRNREEFEMALSNHQEAVEILAEIGAKHDLAESYYQLGLTYQAMGETVQSDTAFQASIRLFTEMEAPKQRERVTCSIMTWNSRLIIPGGVQHHPSPDK